MSKETMLRIYLRSDENYEVELHYNGKKATCDIPNKWDDAPMSSDPKFIYSVLVRLMEEIDAII